MSADLFNRIARAFAKGLASVDERLLLVAAAQGAKSVSDLSPEAQRVLLDLETRPVDQVAPAPARRSFAN